VVGHLTALHGVMHGLPLTYNKDLQEDKEHLFDAVDTIEISLAAATGMIAGARWDRERMRAAATDELIAATDVADLLVGLGMPFREAHGVVARLVRTVVDGGKSLSELTSEELAGVSATLAEHREQFDEVLVQSSWLESKVSEGGTSLARVKEQAGKAHAVLDDGAAG
jgi:argininosuccinate lyase